MRCLILLAMVSACGAEMLPPLVWREPPRDPAAKPMSIELDDGQNGTELVLGALEQARARSLTLSQLELQLGRCVRQIAVHPDEHPVLPSHDVDRITYVARESTFHCAHHLDLELVPGEGGGLDGPKKLSDGEMVESDRCERTPVEHVVTRYRFEIDHGFVPPDWREIERWTHVALAFGPPHCNAAPARTTLRAYVHTGLVPPAQPAALASPPSRATEVVALVHRARVAADAGRAAEATELAERALAIWVDAGELADPAARELADAIASAHFLAIEAEVDRFVHREGPARADAAWAAEQAAEIDLIAGRYEQIRDLVRLPGTGRWLRAGAGKLATLHLHTAAILEQAGQVQAAGLEREVARSLNVASRPPGSDR